MAGNISTLSLVKISFLLLEFNKQCLIEASLHIFKELLGSYSMILGMDLLKTLGIIINYEDSTCIWGFNTIPMRDKGTSAHEHLTIKESEPVQKVTTWLKKILDEKYEPTSLDIKNSSMKSEGEKYTHD